MAEPVSILSLIARKLIFDFFTEPEKIIKFVLIVIAIFIFLLIFPTIILFAILPDANDEYVEIYKRVGNTTNVSWVDMLVLDTVRLDNNFDNISYDDIVNTAFDYLDIKAKKYKYNKKEREWKKISTTNIDDYDDAKNFVENRGYNESLDDIEYVMSSFNEINDKEFTINNKKYKYKIEYKSLGIDDLLSDLSEDKKEWAYKLLADNIIPQIYGEYIELPERIDVISSGFFAFPTPDLNVITSDFGWRTHPVTGKRSFHTGIDISGKNANGKPIIASADGQVTVVSYSNGNAGYWVELKHADSKGNIWTTRYLHMAQINVLVGDTVNKGDVIGAVGNTGRSTGPHLHFEMRFNEQLVNPLDYVGNY